MTPKFLMSTGAAIVVLFGGAAIVVGVFDLSGGALWFNAIMGGAIFGKGYGVHEERNRRQNK